VTRGNATRSHPCVDTLVNNAPRPAVLEELAWPAVRARAWPVALMPWGATEPHNTHLPYGTDTLLGREVAARVAATCAERGLGVIALPAMPFGVNTTQLDLPMTLNVMPTTQLAVLRDVVRSLEPHGVRAIVLLNAHGGNELRALVRELTPSTSIVLVIANWWQAADHAVFAEPGDMPGRWKRRRCCTWHTGRTAGRGAMGGQTECAHGRARRLGRTPRRWTQVTADTGWAIHARGDGAGGAICRAGRRQIAQLCEELAVVDAGAMYR
jgi:creatinine amidohydrolase